MIDIHSHILPGVDDGPKTLSGSLAVVQKLVDQGVTSIIATPHYVDETCFISTKSQNQTLLDSLAKELKRKGVKVKLYLGNEIYINDKIAALIKAGRIATLANGKYILVELPLDEEYSNYIDLLRDLIDDNYRVILAHPERYAIIQKDFEVAKELSLMGVLLQCNIASILGKYGKGAKKTVKKLIKSQMVFTFGSDTHHAGKKDEIILAKKKLLKFYDERDLERLLVDNPSKIIGL